MKNLLKHHVVYKNIALFYLIVSLLTRVILLIHPITQSHFSFVDYLKIFSFGILNDLFVFVLIGFILWLYLIFISDSKFKKPYGYLILGIFVCTLLYIASGKSILSEYGGVLPEIGLAFVGLKTILFALLLFFEKNRKKIRFVLFSFTIFLFVLLIIQNAVSEFYFWNEFGVRYNFIAVDYLVYTNTVIGNIMESYPVVPLFSIIGIVSVLSTYFIIQKSKKYLDEIPNIKTKISIVLGQLALIALALFTIPNLAKKEDSSNVFTNELQK